MACLRDPLESLHRDSGRDAQATPSLRNFPIGNSEESSAARTIPQARYDWINNRLVLTWHEMEFKTEGTHTGPNNSLTLVDGSANFIADGIGPDDWVINETDGSSYLVDFVINPTSLALSVRYFFIPGAEGRFDSGDLYTLKKNRADVYYTSKTTSGWIPKVRLPLNNRNDDQAYPSIDFEINGRLVVSFMDRSATGQAFQPRWIQINPAGGKIAEGSFPNAPSNNPVNNGAFSFVGD